MYFNSNAKIKYGYSIPFMQQSRFNSIFKVTEFSTHIFSQWINRINILSPHAFFQKTLLDLDSLWIIGWIFNYLIFSLLSSLFIYTEDISCANYYFIHVGKHNNNFVSYVVENCVTPWKMCFYLKNYANQFVLYSISQFLMCICSMLMLCFRN